MSVADWPFVAADERSQALWQQYLSIEEETNSRITSAQTTPPPLPSNTAAKKKLQFLCLHGYEQNGEQLRAKSGALRRPVNALAEFHFIDGPHAVDSLSSGEAEDDGSSSTSSSSSISTAGRSNTRGWFRFDALEAGGSAHLGGLCESLEVVASAVEAANLSGVTFDGVLGFSQGAALANALAIVQAYRSAFLDDSRSSGDGDSSTPMLSSEAAALVAATPKMAFGAFVIVSGFLPNDAGLLELCAALQRKQKQSKASVGVAADSATNTMLPLTTPSFHAYGATDALVPPAASAAVHASAAVGSKISCNSSNIAVETALGSMPHHKRMLPALPRSVKDGDEDGNSHNANSSEAQGVPLFGGSACAVAIHGGGHLVPTDKAANAAFKQFVADFHAQRLGSSPLPSGRSANVASAKASKGKGPAANSKSSKAPKHESGSSAAGADGSNDPIAPIKYVVMLHGFTQSGKLFEQRSANFVKKVLKPLGLVPVYPDAPMLCPALYVAADRNDSDAKKTSKQSAEGETRDVQRAWFVPKEMDPQVRPSKSTHWEGWQDSLEGLRPLLAGVVGVVGFSQGALMAALALAQPRSPTNPSTSLPPPSSSPSREEHLPPAPSVSSVGVEVPQATPSELRFGILLCSGDAHDPSAIEFLEQRRIAVDSRPQKATRVLCISGQDDPLVSTEDCRALAHRLAHNGSVRGLLGDNGKNSSEKNSETSTNGIQCEELGRTSGEKSSALDDGPAYNTEGAPSSALVSFLSVAGGHGMPPGRDMASIKAFVADSLA